jgi:hypothetical protein
MSAMNRISELRLLIAAVLIAFVLPLPLKAQSDDGNVSLGDLARALRKEKKADPPAPVVIDNDNLSQVTKEIEKQRQQGNVGFLFDAVGKDIHVSSPDVTCNLAFSAQTSALLSDPYVPEDLPGRELAKLDGPATIQGDSLQVTVHNGTDWTVKEITVGLTILRRADKNQAAVSFGNAKLMPAVAGDNSADAADASGEKQSDFTILYHLKGSAAPSSTTIFRQDLGATLGADQDWHWAIIQAQGLPPKPAQLNSPAVPSPPSH